MSELQEAIKRLREIKNAVLRPAEIDIALAYAAEHGIRINESVKLPAVLDPQQPEAIVRWISLNNKSVFVGANYDDCQYSWSIGEVEL